MSSNHHKHHHSSDKEPTKTKLSRSVLAFLLFASLLLLSTAICFRVSIANPDRIAGALTDADYAEALYYDAQQFSYDLCDECSIPKESVDNVLTPESVKKINEAYYVGNLCASEQYNPSSYKDEISDLGDRLSESVSDYLKENKIAVSPAQKENGTRELSGRITAYLTEIVELEYVEQLKSVTTIGRAGLMVVIVVMAILSILLALGSFAVGSKKYRNVRSLAHSFTAVGIVDFIMVLGVEIVKKTKTLYIFPLYLRETAMGFVNATTLCFVEAGFLVLALALILITIVWKLKRDEK